MDDTTYLTNKPEKFGITIVNDDCYIIDGVLRYFRGKGVAYQIPYGVTRIDVGAFSDNATLKAVTIPDSVIEIGEFAFVHCTTIATLTIPHSVKVLGNGVFNGWTESQTLRLPRGWVQTHGASNAVSWHTGCKAKIVYY